MENIIVSDLKQAKDSWTFDEDYQCWALKNVIYTPFVKVPDAQRLNIFVPKAYMNGPGKIDENGENHGYTAATAPVIFENNSAGYHQMPNVDLGEGRCYARPYLNQGYVYVSCGNRGSESVDEDGNLCGKSPANLVDIKTAIRFVRHNADALPGDMDKMISVGWSAGGAMSSLIGLSGNNEKFDDLLRENGAFMDESDAVFAAQIYCPIVDLDHADLAYEWAFSADSESMDSPAGPAEVMTPFKRALSDKLKAKYIEYFNLLDLKAVEDGRSLEFGPDGRSGSAYDYYLFKLSQSATKYLEKLEKGELEEKYSVEDYISGNYTFEVKKFPRRRPEDGPRKPGAGPQDGNGNEKRKPEIIQVQGDEKSEWLSWDGQQAVVKDLDSYVLNHYRRMKPCTSFDTLNGTSGENQVFGSEELNFQHFDFQIAQAIAELKDEFPEEYSQCYGEYMKDADDGELKYRVDIYNPLNYARDPESNDQAQYYRINVGAKDADTAHVISMELASTIKKSHENVEYNLIWDKPHCEADYEGEVIDWIERIVKQD